MTEYHPHPREPRHWLLTDGSLILEPQLEQSPQGRNIRIRGTTEQVPRSEMHTLLYKWAYDKAKRKLSKPVLQFDLDLNTIEENFRHVESFRPFTENSTMSTAGWIFKHPDMPVYARVSMVVVTQETGPYVEVIVRFPNLSYGMPHRWSNSGLRHKEMGWPESRETQDPWVHREFEADTRDILARNGITFGRMSYPNAEAAVSAAIREYRVIDSLEELHLPDVRGINHNTPDEGVLHEMKLSFRGRLQPESYLSEMLEFVDLIQPADEIVEHWNAIADILKRRGVSVTKLSQLKVLGALTGSEEGKFTTDVAAVRMNSKGTIRDPNHDISINLHSGVVYVSCRERTRDMEADVLAYEIAKERAAITGEADLMEAFLASLGKTQETLELLKIVNASK